jgi:hypothetical protein
MTDRVLGNSIAQPPNVTWSAEVRALLADLLAEVSAALGGQLCGLYVFGSLATSAFDERISDVDLFAVTCETLDQDQFEVLAAAHQRLDERHTVWAGRVEFAYAGQAALRALGKAPVAIAAKRTAEPFHLMNVGVDWLLNLHVVRSRSVALVGPPAAEFIAEIDDKQLRTAVAARMEDWRSHVHDSADPQFQAYAVLTACRALYTFDNAALAGKPEAAAWASDRLPDFAALIAQALRIRNAGTSPSEAGPLEAADFVHVVADIVTDL